MMSPTREAVEVDRSQQFEEASTMFRELGKVLVDHVERRLKHGIEDSRDLGRKQWLVGSSSIAVPEDASRLTHPKTADDGCHYVEHLRIASCWNVAIVIS